MMGMALVRSFNVTPLANRRVRKMRRYPLSALLECGMSSSWELSSVTSESTVILEVSSSVVSCWRYAVDTGVFVGFRVR